MNFKDFCVISEVTQVGYQDIESKKMFGPVYHGTTEDNMSQILQTGFKFGVEGARTGQTRHGYEIGDYAKGIPAPVHHLGYGVYFTQIENIGKMYQGSSKKLNKFYLDVPNLLTINWGSPNTMMKWWQENCYDMPPLASLTGKSATQIENLRIQATQKLTHCLSSKYDAVLYKGKGLRSLLDGNQVCVFDPSKIYIFNPNLNSQNEFLVGDRVKIRGMQLAVEVIIKRPKNIQRDDPFDILFGIQSEFYYSVKVDNKTLEKISQFYKPEIIKTLTLPEFNEFFEMRMKNSGASREETIESFSNYIFSSLKLNMPESLLEKKVPKGARITQQ